MQCSRGWIRWPSNIHARHRLPKDPSTGNMRQFILASAGFLLAIALPGHAAPAQDKWPPLPSRLNFVTPYGTLGIKSYEYLYESRLKINDTEISPPIEGLLNITYAFSLPKAEAALVSISDGNEKCPVKYRWIILRDKGYTVSPPFGSCSTRVKVSAKGRRFLVQTPNAEKPDKIDTYIYDGKTLTRKR
jgi:hypothetical protein